MRKPESMLDSVCQQIFHIQLVFLIGLTFMGFSLVAMWYLDPTDPGFIISAMNVVALLFVLSIFGSLTWVCNNRTPGGR